MNKFSMMQYKMDIDYISANIVNDISIITDEEEIINNYKMRYVEYNNELYAMYKKKSNDKYEMLLIPVKENILENDFADIVMLTIAKDEVNLLKIKRENSLVEASQYDFGFNNDGSVFSKLYKYELDDTENKLLKRYNETGLYLEDFIMTYKCLLPLEPKTVTYIKRDGDTTIGHKIDDLEILNEMEYIEDSYNFYMGNSEKIDLDNNKSLIQLHNSLINKEKVMTK